MSLSHDQIVRITMRERVRLLAFAKMLVQDTHDAEDLLQDVSALAILKSAEIDSEEHLLPWLRQAARFKAMNLRKKRGRNPLLFDGKVLDLIEADWSSQETAASSEAMRALEQCLHGLSPYSRTIINSRYRDGLTGDKLGEAVGRKMGSVYVQLSRIHAALRNCVRVKLAGGQSDA